MRELSKYELLSRQVQELVEGKETCWHDDWDYTVDSVGEGYNTCKACGAKAYTGGMGGVWPKKPQEFSEVVDLAAQAATTLGLGVRVAKPYFADLVRSSVSDKGGYGTTLIEKFSDHEDNPALAEAFVRCRAIAERK